MCDARPKADTLYGREVSGMRSKTGVPRFFLLALSLLLLMHVTLSFLNFNILTQWRTKALVKTPARVFNHRKILNFQNRSIIERLRREQILSNEASQSKPIDVHGRNWIEAQDHNTLFCLNLHDLIQRFGTAKPSDNRLWKSNNCSGVLRMHYDSW